MPKSLAIYGNCQANALASLLQISKDFNEKYQFVRMKPVHRITIDELEAFLGEHGDTLGAFIHQPIGLSFRKGLFADEVVRSRLSRESTVISFPSLQFYGYHASAFALKGMGQADREFHFSLFKTPGADTFHFLQVIRAFLDGLPVEGAMMKYHGGYPGDDELVVEFANRSIAHMKASEEARQTDVKLSEFTQENYRDRLLYNTPRHPTSYLLAKAVEKLAEGLGVEFTEQELERMIAKEPLRFPQYPLQEFTREALELAFDGATDFRSKYMSMPFADMVAKFYEFYASCSRAYLVSEYERQMAHVRGW